jgi:hypothetical protein
MRADSERDKWRMAWVEAVLSIAALSAWAWVVWALPA